MPEDIQELQLEAKDTKKSTIFFNLLALYHFMFSSNGTVMLATGLEDRLDEADKAALPAHLNW